MRPDTSASILPRNPCRSFTRQAFGVFQIDDDARTIRQARYPAMDIVHPQARLHIAARGHEAIAGLDRPAEKIDGEGRTTRIGGHARQLGPVMLIFDNGIAIERTAAVAAVNPRKRHVAVGVARRTFKILLGSPRSGKTAENGAG